MHTILVVDDKELLRDSVATTLQRAGFTVITAVSGDEALETIASRRPDAVVTDFKMPGLSGIELIERAKQIDEDLPIVLMTAFGTIQTAVQAMRLGAFDYVTKPFEGDELIISVKRALENARLKRDNAVLRIAAEPRSGGGENVPRGMERILGRSPAIREIKDRLKAIAASQGTVLISGESGTGKEVVARAIHEMSPRAAEPFLAMNCAAMSESLLESELFGHEKGAFTGADRLRKGRFELAHQGTLLLDEVSEVRPQLQAKLLRVLQERAFERVGSSTTIGVDVRVIATTNRDLTREVASHSFRQDLYFRLNVLPLHLPPLRQRVEDITLLAPHFVQSVCAREGRPAKRFTETALEALMAYHWPGNVRELQNLCERAVVLSLSDDIGPELIQPWLNAGDAPSPAAHAVAAAPAPRLNGFHHSNAHLDEPKHLCDIEREIIVSTLGRFQGHRQKTARALGIGVRTLGLKLKKWKQEKLVEETL
ncbi:MAG: sigma-54-dependent Fis family transcriptional regulator [Phycisphaerae bacterium]|nr:sigma-54-dependent Fis family transcriptional regulator [Phycisphaerae bacterium]